MTLVPDTELLNPLKFPESFSDFLRGPLVGSWIGAGNQNAKIISLELADPFPHSLERGEGLELELIINHTYVRKPP